MPFLLRATPRLDLAGWSLRSEVNLDGDRACWRHIRPDPQRYETSQRLPSSLHQGILRARLLTFGSMPVTRLLLISRVSGVVWLVGVVIAPLAAPGHHPLPTHDVAFADWMTDHGVLARGPDTRLQPLDVPARLSPGLQRASDRP